MLTITISPQLHNFVKFSKALALNDSSYDKQSFLSMISIEESRSLLSVINNNNKGKIEQDEPVTGWT